METHPILLKFTSREVRFQKKLLVHGNPVETLCRTADGGTNGCYIHVHHYRTASEDKALQEVKYLLKKASWSQKLPVWHNAIGIMDQREGQHSCGDHLNLSPQRDVLGSDIFIYLTVTELWNAVTLYDT